MIFLTIWLSVCPPLWVACRRCTHTADSKVPVSEKEKAADLETSSARKGPTLQPLPPAEGEGYVVDPFCGLKLRKTESAAEMVYKGITYYFCSKDHMEAFRTSPDKYLSIDTDND